MARKGWATIPVADLADASASQAVAMTAPPPGWAQLPPASVPSLPPELADLATKFDALDK